MSAPVGSGKGGWDPPPVPYFEDYEKAFHEPPPRRLRPRWQRRAIMVAALILGIDRMRFVARMVVRKR